MFLRVGPSFCLHDRWSLGGTKITVCEETKQWETLYVKKKTLGSYKRKLHRAPLHEVQPTEQQQELWLATLLLIQNSCCNGAPAAAPWIWLNLIINWSKCCGGTLGAPVWSLCGFSSQLLKVKLLLPWHGKIKNPTRLNAKRITWNHMKFFISQLTRPFSFYTFHCLPFINYASHIYLTVPWQHQLYSIWRKMVSL